MAISTVRLLAFKFIEAALKGEEAVQASMPGHDESTLSPEDRGLYNELTLGVLREWGFLSAVIGLLAKRPPKGRLRTIMALAAYQLLFLDRVPSYAVFSETKKLCELIKATEPERQFSHGVLKAFEREKASLLERREAALGRLKAGNGPDDEFEWGVLNAPKNLVDAFTVVDPQTDTQKSANAAKKGARVRAVKALAAMRRQSELVGYLIPSRQNQKRSRSERYQSKIAPHALKFESGPELNFDLEDGVARIQGEASQWACNLAAQILREAQSREDKVTVRVLEMAAGKGGKCIGTLTALTHLLGGMPGSVPELEWVAADASGAQLQIFERDTLKIIQAVWPQVKVKTLRTNFQSEEHFEELSEGFDFIWLDAPCTGFGTLAKLPQIALTRGESAYEEAKRLALLQQTLCRAGTELMADDGRLMYSVCTLTRPETHDITKFCVNELGAERLLSESLWPGSEPAPSAEGFYCAIFR